MHITRRVGIACFAATASLSHFAMATTSSATSNGIDVSAAGGVFQTHSPTVIWIHNRTDKDRTVTVEVSTKADPALLRTYNSGPVPAVGPGIFVPKFGRAGVQRQTQLLPKGLREVTVHVHEYGQQGEQRELATFVVPAATKSTALPHTQILTECPSTVLRAAVVSSDGRRTTGTLDSNESFLVEQIYDPKVSGWTNYAYVHGPCASTKVTHIDAPQPVPPLDRLPFVQDLRLTHDGATLIVPAGRLRAVGANRVWLRNTTRRNISTTLTIGGHRKRIDLHGYSTQFIEFPNPKPMRINVEFGGQKVALPVAREEMPRAPHLVCSSALERGVFTEQQKFVTGGTSDQTSWFDQPVITSETTYRVIGGDPVTVLGYVLGPCWP